jgi:hypothetical protein
MTVFPIAVNDYFFMATAGCGVFGVDSSVQTELFLTFALAVISTMFYYTDQRCLSCRGMPVRVGLLTFACTFTVHILIIFVVPIFSLAAFICIYLVTKNIEVAVDSALKPFRYNPAYYYNEQITSQGNHWIKDKLDEYGACLFMRLKTSFERGNLKRANTEAAFISNTSNKKNSCDVLTLSVEEDSFMELNPLGSYSRS